MRTGYAIGLPQTIVDFDRVRVHLGVTKGLGLKPSSSRPPISWRSIGADDTYEIMLLNQMQARGVFIRKPAEPNLNRCIRMSVGTPKGIALACDALKDITETTSLLKMPAVAGIFLENQLGLAGVPPGTANTGISASASTAAAT